MMVVKLFNGKHEGISEKRNPADGKAVIEGGSTKNFYRNKASRQKSNRPSPRIECAEFVSVMGMDSREFEEALIVSGYTPRVP
jgi:hypothetical protein